MRRKLILILSSMLLLALIAGCSTGLPKPTVTGSTYPNEATYATTTATYKDSESMDKGAGNVTNPNRKIIRDASLYLEAKDVSDTYSKLLAFATSHGGYEFSRTQQTNESGEIMVDAVLKIDPAYVDAFLEYARTLGTVISAGSKSQEITADYYDAQTRLKTMESTLQNYYSYLEKAKDIDETLKIQQMIDGLTLDIESLKGQLKLWDSLVSESAITLSIRETPKPVKIEPKREINWSALSWDDMIYLMKSGFMKVASASVTILEWLAIILVVTSPLWIIGLVITLIVLRRKRRFKKQLQEANAAAQAQAPDQTDTPPG
jgi:hypothetical protein